MKLLVDFCGKKVRPLSGMFVLSIMCILTGCSTPEKFATHKAAYASGHYKESVDAFKKDMDKRVKKAGKDEDGTPATVKGNTEYALEDMEIGSGYRAIQEFSSSLDAYERAEQGIREQQEANLASSITLQLGAILTNDNSLPYQIQEYDSIMVNTYKAMNLLQQGEIDKARVEFRRVEERQRMAVETFQKQIAKEKAEEAKTSESTTSSDTSESPEEGSALSEKIKKIIAEKFNEAKDVVTGAIRDGENKNKMDEYSDNFNADSWGAIEAFTNPFATYMQGLFLLVYGEDQSDAESAVLAFSKAFGKEPDQNKNPAVKALNLATAIANGNKQEANLNNKVFIIFENGLGPEKEEYMIPILIPLQLNGNMQIIDASLVLPKLVKRNEAFSYLSICENGAELAKTVSVCNMDAVVAAEFREKMPQVLFRNVMQSGIKAVLQALTIDTLAKQGIPTFVSNPIITAIFHYTKSADLRIWSSLPKNFQVAVVDRPVSGTLQIMVPGAPAPVGIAQIPEGSPSIVFIHTPSAAVPLTVNVISKVSK